MPEEEKPVQDDRNQPIDAFSLPEDLREQLTPLQIETTIAKRRLEMLTSEVDLREVFVRVQAFRRLQKMYGISEENIYQQRMAVPLLFRKPAMFFVV